jgi:hypothetical protein
LAVEDEREMSGITPQQLERSLVPDDHGAGAAPLPAIHTLVFSRTPAVAPDRDGKPAHRRVQGRAFWNRPGAQLAVDLQTQIEVQCGGIVQLDDEALAAGPRAERGHCGVELTRPIYAPGERPAGDWAQLCPGPWV